MSHTSDEYMAELRSRAEARKMGVEPPPFTVTGDEGHALMEEIAVGAEDVRLLVQWLETDATRTLSCPETGTMEMHEGVILLRTLTFTDSKLTLSKEERTAIEAEINPS